MLNAIRAEIEQLADPIRLLPGWLIGGVVLLAAIALALLFYTGIVKMMRSTLGARHPNVRALFTQTKGPLRLALIVLALSIALPLAPIDSTVANGLSRAMHVAFIALVGWIAMVAVQIFTQVYLSRFRIDTEDNLLARKHVTQIGILKRAADVLIFIITLGFVLMSFEEVRQYGVSLFASAGVAGIAVGLAARPLLSNLIAGVQIAMAQPIRIDDAVIVEGEWGTIEEITTTYVIIKLWDWRRMVVPLSYFIEKPFQNWTRETSALIGAVILYVDYNAPIAKMRERLSQIARESPLCDGRVIVLQVSDAKEHTIEVRALVSARSAPAAWDLRCEVREKLIEFLRTEHPDALPRTRQQIVTLDNTTELAPRTMGANRH
ncbi:MAG: mechanosensitive ion channel protein MscS [Proteobacteria bacterium SG_bin9]|nr:MAG: mechanosensitive ion channel protein MscS [Proteobacteria bacterium SG_bin9]